MTLYQQHRTGGLPRPYLYLSLSLSLSSSLALSLYLSLSFCPSIYLSIYLSRYTSNPIRSILNPYEGRAMIQGRCISSTAEILPTAEPSTPHHEVEMKKLKPETTLFSGIKTRDLHPETWSLKQVGENSATLYQQLDASELPTAETRDQPKTETRNPKPEARHPKPEARNPTPETRNQPKLAARSPKPETRSPKPKARNPKPGSRRVRIQ